MELDDLRGPSENVIICCDTPSAVTEDGKKEWRLQLLWSNVDVLRVDRFKRMETFDFDFFSFFFFFFL